MCGNTRFPFSPRPSSCFCQQALAHTGQTSSSMFYSSKSRSFQQLLKLVELGSKFSASGDERMAAILTGSEDQLSRHKFGRIDHVYGNTRFLTSSTLLFCRSSRSRSGFGDVDVYETFATAEGLEALSPTVTKRVSHRTALRQQV